MGWTIPKRPGSRTLTHCAVTKPSKGAGPWTVFPLDVFFQVPGGNNPAARGVPYESVLRSGGKANGQVSFLFSLYGKGIDCYSRLKTGVASSPTLKGTLCAS